MATVTKTVTLKVTSYTSATVTYSITETDTDVTIRFTNVKWTNTRSGGLTEAISWSLASAIKSSGLWPTLNVSGSASKGAKTWSKTLSASKTTAKTHTSLSDVAGLGAEFRNTSGDHYHKDASVTYTRPALQSYAITLDANGGVLRTESLTKWYGEPLSLTTGFTPPDREGYRFEGWAEAAGAPVLNEYTANTATTLYAAWTPIITGVSVEVQTLRVGDGDSTSESDDGTYCYGTVRCGATGGAAGTVTLAITADDPDVVFDTPTLVTRQKHSLENFFVTISFRAHNCTTESNIVFTASASVSNGSASGEADITAVQSDTLSAAYFPIDILGDNYWDADTQTGERPGHGIAFGLPCKKEGFAVGMDLFFQQWAGVIQMFAGTTPPLGWLLCDGSAVSRTEYEVLYAAIGDTWGAGDGSTTFNLPDLRGRAPIGAGTGTGLSARTLGGTGGVESVTLNAAQSGLPAHTHADPGTNFLGNDSTVARHTTASGSGASNTMYSSGATSRYSATGGVSGGAKNASSAHDNMQPFAVVNYIIHTGKTS